MTQTTSFEFELIVGHCRGLYGDVWGDGIGTGEIMGIC